MKSHDRAHLKQATRKFWYHRDSGYLHTILRDLVLSDLSNIRHKSFVHFIEKGKILQLSL